MGWYSFPKSELFNYVQQGDTDFILNPSAEPIRLSSIPVFNRTLSPSTTSGEYKIIYLPYPVMLKQETAAKLRKFVEQGGTLVSEGLPGYFGDHGHVGTVQPNYGLDEVFGAREIYVEFAPDISDDLMFEVKGSQNLWPLFPAGL